jgi:hypothetical protein
MSETVMITVSAGDPVLADLLEASGQLHEAMIVRGMAPVVYLWRLSQDVVGGYDTFDSCVVAAVDEASAKRVHPSEFVGAFDDSTSAWLDSKGNPPRRPLQNWAPHPDRVVAKRIGATAIYAAGAVVCTSFNAG